MEAETGIAPPETDAVLTRALLHLYECVLDERHVEQMMMLVGSWLSETDEGHHVLNLERHARTILETVARRLPVSTLAGAGPDVRVAALGEQAKAALERRHGLLIDEADWLEFARRAIDGPVSMIVHCYCGPDQTQTLGVLASQSEDDRHDLSLTVSGTGLDETVAEMLRNDLHLTRSELRVVNLALLGLSSSEIADRINRSRETVRSQMKAATAKLAVSGQAELGAAIRKIEMTVRGGSPVQKALSAPRLVEPQASLAFERYGPANGRPILYVHCFLHGRHLPAGIASALAERGYAIWSPSRPGFGTSDWPGYEGTEQDLLVWLGDALAGFVDEHGLGAVDILAHATGFGVAYSFANRYPELTRKLVGLDPVPPASSLQNILEFVGLFRASALAMFRTPATFDLMHHFVLKRLSGFRSPEKRMRRHILYPSVELETLETEAGIAAMTLNVRDLIAQDLKGCIAEARAYRSRWDEIAQNVNTRPRCTVFSTRDNPFVSKEGAARFARSIDANLIELGSAFPHLAHLPQLIDHFSGGHAR